MSNDDTTHHSSSILLEIGTEEIPSRFLPNAISDLASIAARTFGEYRVDYSDIAVFATPRRLAVMVGGAAAMQKDNIREVFGPARKAAFDDSGNPTKAAAGFASSLGLSVSDLRIKHKGKGEYVAAVIEERGAETRTILPDLLKKIVLSLHFPKSMRWGNGTLSFVRPISWILALYGAEKVEFEIDGLKSGNQTKGHRFLSPAAFQIRDISSYKQFLETNFVILDQARRKETILKTMNQLSQSAGLQIIADEELLDTVNFLVEYPVPVLCGFDSEYLKLPKELLITVMKDHQKYFALSDPGGSLSSSFIVVSNTRADNAETVRVGAQRVIKARFDDARFYYSEDSAKTLADRIEGLKNVTFHDSLGSLLDKTERIAFIAGFIAEKLIPELKDSAVRAAMLSKTDLITGVVREFPELQGVMGRYYAINDREDPRIADALEEQYLPRNSGDRVPPGAVGAILSLADKIDNIASFFSIGLIPTGSEDPFALRRQAMAVVSILLEKGYSVSLKDVFSAALAGLKKAESPEPVLEKIMNFMGQRTEFIFSSAGHDQDIIKAVLSLAFNQPLSSITARMDALAEARKESPFPDFLLAVKRVNNIVPQTPLAPVQPSLFQQDEERNLYSGLCSVQEKLHALLEKGDFPAAIRTLLPITPAINLFFDKVMVMDKREEIKANRLSLLREVWESAARVADFSVFQT